MVRTPFIFANSKQIKELANEINTGSIVELADTPQEVSIIAYYQKNLKYYLIAKEKHFSCYYLIFSFSFLSKLHAFALISIAVITIVYPALMPNQLMLTIPIDIPGLEYEVFFRDHGKHFLNLMIFHTHSQTSHPGYEIQYFLFGIMDLLYNSNIC